MATNAGTNVLFTTFGSLGDIYPYVAIGKELLARGISVTLSTSLYHKDLIERSGLRFFHSRPDLEDDEEMAQDIIRKIMDKRTGSEYVLRELIMPNVKAMYEDWHAASADASLVITHPLSYGAIAAARQRGLPWIATVLAPASMWSKYDPPAMAKAPLLPFIRRTFGTGVSGAMINLAKKQTYSWTEPYLQLQRELGLPVLPGHAFFEGQFSPLKNLALFSPLFANPQPDWPPNTIATGFPFDDERDDERDDKSPAQMRDNPALQNFLQSGPAPIVFTLGSSAVWDAGTFYIDSVEAARRLGMRAVLLVGKSQRNQLPDHSGADIATFEYVPHAQIFPHAAAIVHQGGVGTTAQALRAGKPQLVMPYSHDQFDNANRVVALNCGGQISRANYRGTLAVSALRTAMQPTKQQSAQAVGDAIRNEHGTQRAADEIMATLQSSSSFPL